MRADNSTLGPYRAFFYSNEGDEPAHVHVRAANREAKFWLHDLTPAVNAGFLRTNLMILCVIFGYIATNSWRLGMSILEIDVGDLRARSVEFTTGELVVTLTDGRKITTPLDWYPRLKHASQAERANLEIMPMGIHWPDLDEDLGIVGMLKGRRS